MTHKLFLIRDSKSETFNPPFAARTHGEAERYFRTLVNNKETSIAKFPEDYDLYFIGDFDDQSGKLAPLDTPNHIVKAVNCNAINDINNKM